MKQLTIQDQYNLIKEGKGNKDFFMKSSRNQFPDLINQFTDFDTAIKIFKSKSIISEAIGGLVTKGTEPEWHQIFKQNIKENSEDIKSTLKKTNPEVDDLKIKGFDFTDLDNIDNIYGEQFIKGFYTEMKDPKNEEKTALELKKIVTKNLSKNRLYYVEEDQFGTKGLGYKIDVPGLGTPKEAKGKYKSSGYGNIKEGKLDEKSNRMAYNEMIKLGYIPNIDGEKDENYYSDVDYSIHLKKAQELKSKKDSFKNRNQGVGGGKKMFEESSISLVKLMEENQVNNKYVELNDDGFYSINLTKALEYLEQFDDEDIDASQFINDDEGWGEFEQYLENIEKMSDEELEDSMKNELFLYYGLD
jgi:hypothetical protein